MIFSDKIREIIIMNTTFIYIDKNILEWNVLLLNWEIYSHFNSFANKCKIIRELGWLWVVS